MSRRLLAFALGLVASSTILRRYSARTRRSCRATFPPQNFISADGVRLHYAEAGTGQPVVLVHGDGGSFLDFMLSPLFACLAQEYRVLAFDRPGHGYSEGADGGDNVLWFQARLLHDALQKMGIEKPVLVGHSRGGSVLAAYLVRYPEGVAGAVSVAGDFYGGKTLGWYYHLGALPLLGRLLVDTVYTPLLRAGDYALLRAGLNAAYAPEGRVRRQYLAGYTCMWNRRGNIAGSVAELAAANKLLPRLAERYGSVETRVVIVQGDEDQSVPWQEAVRLHEALPHSTLILAKGGGHELHFTRVGLVVEAVRVASGY